MANTLTQDRVSPDTTPKPHFLDGLARRAVLVRLTQLAHGKLVLVDGRETRRFGQVTPAFPLRVTVQVHDPRFYSDLAFGGSIGAAESYMHGAWSTDNLTGLVQLFARNRAALDGLEGGLARLTAPLQKLFHWIRRNTRDGSRRNIAAHYDLSNDFFRLFLDETMMYSAAIFTRPDMTLHAAQLARLGHICRKLDLKPTDHLLEIGTGWGGLAVYAASHYGCRVTTTTISDAQYRLARERVQAAGLAERITVLKQDYRDLSGQYDKLVSIEMIEAIGHQYLDTYFARCSALLAPHGLMLLQAITIADQHYGAARDVVDFIKRYIFPGSFIPSNTAMLTAVTRASDLRLVDLEDIGPHYATTLQHWRRNFFANLDAVRALGFSEAFIRMWEFYFCYCEGGFRERVISDVQWLLVKPLNRRNPWCPTPSS
jgi:cyclopropane-fatty-acyl-phospholipid synthase